MSFHIKAIDVAPVFSSGRRLWTDQSFQLRLPIATVADRLQRPVQCHRSIIPVSINSLGFRLQVTSSLFSKAVGYC